MTSDREQRRADLLPEEAAVGSDDPEAQAEAVLADSDVRQAERDTAPGDQVVEHRTSEDAAGS